MALRPRRLSIFSLGVLSLLTAAIAGWVHQVSPLRDPSFQPSSANAGSLIPELRGIHEDDWMRGATVLAALLAANLTIVLWQRSRFLSMGELRSRHSALRLLRSLGWLAIATILFGGFWLSFVIYLLQQWLID